MPPSTEDVARSLGLKQPQLQQLTLTVGAWFIIRGKLPNGFRYSLRYEIISIDDREVIFKFDGGDSNNNIFRDNIIHLRLQLIPNRLQRLPNVYGPDLYISFISSEQAPFIPEPGASVTFACEVRDTRPPPKG